MTAATRRLACNSARGSVYNIRLYYFIIVIVMCCSRATVRLQRTAVGQRPKTGRTAAVARTSDYVPAPTAGPWSSGSAIWSAGPPWPYCTRPPWTPSGGASRTRWLWSATARCPPGSVSARFRRISVRLLRKQQTAKNQIKSRGKLAESAWYIIVTRSIITIFGRLYARKPIWASYPTRFLRK